MLDTIDMFDIPPDAAALLVIICGKSLNYYYCCTYQLHHSTCSKSPTY